MSFNHYSHIIAVSLMILISQCAIIHATTLKVTPNESGFGASISGVDVETISDGDFNLIHRALLQHKVIVVKNQSNLTVEGQRHFTKRFGHLHVHLESSSHLPGYQDVNVVSNIKNDKGGYIGLFGKHVENFHSDLSW